jgi:hypothetical protein
VELKNQIKDASALANAEASLPECQIGFSISKLKIQIRPITSG